MDVLCWAKEGNRMAIEAIDGAGEAQWQWLCGLEATQGS